ncbi:MAG: alpha/beta fold hydrolase, partial [Lutimaribacter sp.]
GLRAMQGWNGEAALPMICHPTLLIWGDQDRTYPWAQVQALWQGIGTCQLAVVPGCAHAVHMEWPDLFNQIVAGFLAR